MFVFCCFVGVLGLLFCFGLVWCLLVIQVHFFVELSLLLDLWMSVKLVTINLYFEFVYLVFLLLGVFG